MNRSSVSPRRLATTLVVLLVVLAGLPGLAAAAPVQGAAGTISVAEGETVDGVQAVAGTVVIRGTVTGDVQVAAGTLVIAGTVEGDVNGAAGSVDIRGRVAGDVNVGTGSFTLAEGAVIERSARAPAPGSALDGRHRRRVTPPSAVATSCSPRRPRSRATCATTPSSTDRGATVDGRLVRGLGPS
ncbi:MAG: polymer-forming cytoskeletal protein [Halobacteriales archaeon]|nr:polymer-forming cytoskeletal protein [Halobacteriales archaeon]